MSAIGSKNLERKVIIETFAKLCLDGSLHLRHVPEWAENQEKRKHWVRLREISFLDLYREMKRQESLLTDSEKEKEETMPEPQKDTQPPKAQTVSPTPTPKKKTEKVTDEKAQEVGTQILNTDPMNVVGGKISKKDLIQQMGLSEEEVTAGLGWLKQEKKVKSNRGRNAKWERIA